MRPTVKRSSKARRHAARSSASRRPTAATRLARRSRRGSRSRRPRASRAPSRRAKAMTGVPQAMASIMTRPKGSGQSIGNSSAGASAEEVVLLGLVDLADELDERARRAAAGSASLEVVDVRRVDLGRDPQRHAGPAGDLDGPVEPLLRRDAAEEGEVAAGAGAGRTSRSRGRPWWTVPHPVRLRQRRALRVGDRDQRHVGGTRGRRARRSAGRGGRAAS